MFYTWISNILVSVALLDDTFSVSSMFSSLTSSGSMNGRQIYFEYENTFVMY